MHTTDEIRSAIDAATVPESDALERARMIVVDKLGEWDSLGLDELVESVCEAYEAPSGEPLRLTDVDPSNAEIDTPALRNLRYARAARTAVVDLVGEGVIRAVDPHPGDADALDLTGERNESEDDDDQATASKETTDAAGERAGAEELILSTGPQPDGLRFALASR